MTRQQRIEDLLMARFSPAHLNVENESRMHSVPPGSETHFKVLVVSDAFDGLSRVERHRRVHDALGSELAAGLHALSVRALTVAQWREGGTAGFVSPECQGGSKGDKG